MTPTFFGWPQGVDWWPPKSSYWWPPKSSFWWSQGVDWWPPKFEKIKKSSFDQIFFRLWLGLKNIFRMCIFDFQYQIIDLIHVLSFFWFFSKMWSRPIFMAGFMWSKTVCNWIEICLGSKNKCWDLKGPLKSVLFHIHIIGIWWIFKEIETREKILRIFICG